MRSRRCQPTPADMSTSAHVAAPASRPRKAIAACFAPMVRRPVRRYRRSGSRALINGSRDAQLADVHQVHDLRSTESQERPNDQAVTATRSYTKLAASGYLPDAPCDSVDAIARNHLTAITRKIARLSALRREVTRMIAQCRRGRIAECRVIDALLSDRKAKSPQRPRGAGAKKRPDSSAR